MHRNLDLEEFVWCNHRGGYFEESNGKILIIGEPTTSFSEEEIIEKSLNLAAVCSFPYS